MYHIVFEKIVILLLSLFNCYPVHYELINFRYFELNGESTITTKGSKQVLLKKSSSAHKRFTFTPAISGDGKIVALHVLFSKLKKAPSVNAFCTVDVNTTGMWSQEILQRFLDNSLLPKLRNNADPVLIILDSYGAHLSYINANKESYEKQNIFFSIIPKGILIINF